jgi:alpha-galactosidase
MGKIEHGKGTKYMTKIVIIGAGSSSFGPGTLATIVRSDVLKGCQIALVDLNSEALGHMKTVAENMSNAWGTGMIVSASTDRREVLQDADFVIISIEVPPREALWRMDWEIPIKHGLRQPYGENGGPGGLMHACRQIPPFMEIVRDMEQLCPDAWLINFSNPLPRITRAVTKYSKIKTVGLCHQLDVGYAIAAVLLAGRFPYELPDDLDMHAAPATIEKKRQLARDGRKHLEIKAAGLNHFTWMLDVRDRQTGEDLYPAMREALKSVPDTFEPLTMALFRIFDYCAVPGDTHLCEYIPWTHDATAHPWEHFNLRLYDWDGNAAKRVLTRETIARRDSGEESIEPMKNVYSEGAVELIEAIVSNSNYYADTVNIPNRGAVPNLPDDAVIELPALASGLGITGINMPPLPEPIAELCRREAALVEMVVDTAVTGSRQSALQTLLMDPMVNDIGRAKAILDDYLTSFADYLPQFR